MAIAVVQEPAGISADAVTSVTKAFAGNVTNGNLIVVQVARGPNGANTALVAGDCTRSAGTATTGTVALDKQANVNSGGPCQAGIWSVPVTGTGSCTMQVAGPAGSYFALGIGEYSGTDVSASRVDGTPSGNTLVGSTSPATSGNTTSTGDALFCTCVAFDKSNNTTATVGNSFVQIYEETNGSAHQTGESDRLVISGATTTQGSWTFSTPSLSGWAAVVAAYKIAGGGGGAARRRIRIIT